MMKWKVVKNPRCASADRSLDCLKEKPFPVCISDSNNNTPWKQDPQKENNRQQDSGFIRKPSLVASDCINWKGFLGLTRQRSEINLSNLGLSGGGEPRRSRSEVRGISCDRLTLAYHTPAAPNSTSPPSKSGCWLRGRKRERDTRAKEVEPPPGKTVVIGCSSRRASSRPSESRTITDQTGEAKKPQIVARPSADRAKPSRRDGGKVEEDVIYSEIEHTKLGQSVAKGPAKLGRKKGQAPKPNVLLKESKNDVNLNPNGTEAKEPSNCFVEKASSPSVKPSKKLQNSVDNRSAQTVKLQNSVDNRSTQTVKLQNSVDNRSVQTVKIQNSVDNRSVQTAKLQNSVDNRSVQTAKLNNAVSSEAFLTVKNKISSVVAIAEIHKNNIRDCSTAGEKNTEGEDNTNKKTEEPGVGKKKSVSQLDEIQSREEKERAEEIQIEIPPFRIDTPDYSTLESEFEQNRSSRPTPDGLTLNNLKNNSSGNSSSDSDCKSPDKVSCEGMISSILRGSANDIRNCDPEPPSKKVVRFEKIDLIETYKKNKAESSKESDEDSVISVPEPKPKKLLDVNSNEITHPESSEESPGILEKMCSSSSECLSESWSTDTECHQKSMRVNVLVKNPSAECLLTNCVVDSQVDESQTQLVVKKSFVLTIAKQEKGFRSLCASNKKPEAVSSEATKKDHKISVTFLCSDVPKEPKAPLLPSALRIRSVSVPPQQPHATEVIAVIPPPLVRGRSRDRRSKERQHSKKSKSSKKKDTSFHMPQAVIDELAQVLEKRKPSLDRPTANAK